MAGIPVPQLYSHQVAGHVEESLLSLSGRFILKPMVKSSLFEREKAFYEQMVSEGSHNTNSAIPFTPIYLGLLHYAGVNGTAVPHLVLEDLTCGYRKPNVIDIKMGTCTFEPTATQQKKDSELRKYPYQAEVGFRITGFKVYNKTSQSYVTAGKPFGRSIVPVEVISALAMLFYDGFRVRDDAIKAVIAELETLLLWMRSQARHHFYCTSLLVVFDSVSLDPYEPTEEPPVESIADSFSDTCSPGDERTLGELRRCLATAAASAPLVRVKMIDFAHVVPLSLDNQIPDQGYIWGLKSLIGNLREVQATSVPPGGSSPHITHDVHNNILGMIARADVA
ncbi:hypothetical protein B484DRAFT_441404 [Ochromonadaceae sp. CCMP2298]|nr:hypothetical protein B484DRAFT_441515 [Ochromonadaceae sp. CCMP2298]KAJ1443780.1 hypothetical protein B484DRAFT_441404 [Ochromonadaceae sp. CCMP2298]